MPSKIEKAASKTMGAAKVIKATFRGLDGVFKKLMEEHGEVTALILRVSMSSDASVRAELYPTIRQELLAHEQAELAVVYPELAEYPDTRNIAARHAAEASQLQLAIKALDALDYGDAGWSSGFERLADLVKKHVEEEEKEFFPKAQATIGEVRAKALESRYEASKKGAQ